MDVRKRLVMIGNGMAGVRMIEHLLKLAPDAYDVTIFGAEPHPNYNRIMLSSVLAGDAVWKDIVINDWAWYSDNRIRLLAGHPAVRIDTKRRIVYSEQGEAVAYDALILATGAKPFMLPVPGADRAGVMAFRDIKDCESMIEASLHYRKAVVIGGGLLGLEAARGLLHLGMDVTVVHIHPYLMERQLDEAASRMLQRELEAQGMKFMLKKQTDTIEGTDRVSGLRFTDNTELAADLVVMAVGIRPDIAIAKEAGIATNRGVLVDDWLQTSVPSVFAMGECAEHRGIAYGLVAPLYEQGAVLAKHLAGLETQGYTGSVTSAKLKVSGISLFSAGQYEPAAPDARTMLYQDEAAGIYKKIVIRNDKLIGTVLFGDTADSARLFSLIKSGESIRGKEKALLGFAADAGTGGAADAAVSAKTRLEQMPADEIVCGCNGVTKQAIVDAIRLNQCTSVASIRGCTKASASCGGCKPLVEGLLQVYAGDAAKTQVKEGICGCTVMNRDELVEAIRRMGLKSVKETMHALGWQPLEGCSKCRPALNYYLGMLWPEQYADEKESRFTNERYHANIQKDGTYSVVPRIYGGVTSPAELMKIAEVAQAFDVPMVKFTGGQRLDLLGVKKEDLPRMWEALDMPSGYAYGKALRTVKTCVGDTFCRFGTQDSIAMGIRLEKEFERLNTPAKVKLAVSGCPRNCAEATIKDFGVVAIDGGWELHVGGNGGVHVRATDLLCVVKTADEVVEWAGAFLQYYREHAQWNERTSVWIERVGLDTVKQALAKPEHRAELFARIKLALSKTEDPWKKIVGDGELRKNFAPLPEPAAIQ